MSVQPLVVKLVNLISVQVTLSALHNELNDHQTKAHKEQDDEVLDTIANAFNKLADGFNKVVDSETEVLQEIIDETELNFTLN